MPDCMQRENQDAEIRHNVKNCGEGEIRNRKAVSRYFTIPNLRSWRTFAQEQDDLRREE